MRGGSPWEGKGIPGSVFWGVEPRLEPEWLTGRDQHSELLTGRERAVWRQIKPGDSKDRLIKKTAKPRGKAQANPAPTPPLLPILGLWPRAAEKDICPHGNSRRGGRSQAQLVSLQQDSPGQETSGVGGELTNARKPHPPLTPLTPSLP